MKEIKKSMSFTSKQKGKDTKFNIDLNYSPEYDSFIIKIKEGEGFMAYSSSIERMPLKVIQKLNEMLEEVLIQTGSETEMKEHKMAKGGSLQTHGIELGDTFVKTISGGIQKVKDKNEKIVYIDLSNGERDSQPPLPFADGGGVGIEEDIDLTDDKILRLRKPVMPKRKLTEQEWAEKHNPRAYEYMTKRKMATGGEIDSNNIKLAKRLKVKQWYTKTYPQDDLGQQIRQDLNFWLLWSYMSQGYNVYKILEVPDSLVRERVFEKLSKILEIDYNVIYKKWLNSDNYASGGELVGNQSRIDMNKNGKIDAEDFKILRSSMNGAWRNEQKHVNHNEDYEVRYYKQRPSRTGYKGKRKFDGGGGISNFERLSKVVAKNYEGNRVKPQYQKEYGMVYSKSEAKEVANKVAGKVKLMKKAESGIEVKKGNRGGVMLLAKKIRRDGEKWTDAVKRAGQQLK